MYASLGLNELTEPEQNIITYHLHPLSKYCFTHIYKVSYVQSEHELYIGARVERKQNVIDKTIGCQIRNDIFNQVLWSW